MHRSAGLAIAAFGLMVLSGVPAAAAQPTSRATELRGAALAVANPVAAGVPTSGFATDDSHDSTGHESGTDGGTAEWPEWATTGDSGQDHADGHGDGHGPVTPIPDPAGPDPEGHTGHTEGGDGSSDQGHGGHGDESGPAPQRPRALVLGSFAGVNGAVVLTAAFLRRRSKGEVQRRKSARAAALRDTGHRPPQVRAADPSANPSQS